MATSANDHEDISFGLKSGIQQVFNNTSLLSENPAVSLLLALITILLVTKLLSKSSGESKIASQDGAKTVPGVSYWIPFLGHIPNMAINADGFLKTLRSRYQNGIFALNFGGTRHNMMFTPGLATALLNQKSSHADAEEVGLSFMKKVFGFPANEMHKYDTALPELSACYKYVMQEPYLGEMVNQTAQKTKQNVGNLVTFMQSPVDQMPWEKTSKIQLFGEEGDVVEASLLPLVRDFCAFNAMPSIMGSDLLENFPDLFEDVWKLDRGFLLLAAGLPRWTPFPTVTRAHLARHRNLEALEIFHEQLDKHLKGENTSSKWSSLDDVGALVKARAAVYQKHNFSMRARAASEHAIVWAANANSNTLVFWMINRIYSDRTLLAMLREEISPYVEITQTKNDLPIAELPRISNLDVEGLCTKCPLLKSCYVECLRLDSASWSFKEVKQDFVLQSREKGSQPWLLKKGDFAHAAHDLHNTDPNYFDNPMVWKADRHIKEGTADMGSIRPYGTY
jgi:hypothetical protein